jgi:glutaredoxin
MAETIIIYGTINCEDTARIKNRLRGLDIPFRCINIEHNMAAERFVLFVNRGKYLTPTLVVDRGKHKTILAKPDDEEVDRVLAELGYLVVK